MYRGFNAFYGVSQLFFLSLSLSLTPFKPSAHLSHLTNDPFNESFRSPSMIYDDSRPDIQDEIDKLEHTGPFEEEDQASRTAIARQTVPRRSIMLSSKRRQNNLDELLSHSDTLSVSHVISELSSIYSPTSQIFEGFMIEKLSGHALDLNENDKGKICCCHSIL